MLDIPKIGSKDIFQIANTISQVRENKYLKQMDSVCNSVVAYVLA
jgi:hypothetical protein